MNVDRIHQLADAIENLKYRDTDDMEKTDHAFNMKRFKFPCKSPACIAGWAESLFFFELCAEEQKSEPETEEIAQKVLGLTSSQAENLFFPKLKTADFLAIQGEDKFITAKRAANTLRHLAKTGKINWNPPTKTPKRPK